MRVRELARRAFPWVLTFGAAGVYAFYLAGGGFGYSREHQAMPRLVATRLDNGQSVSDQSLRGSPVILNVWAPSCAPCRHELPSLDRLASDYAGRVQVLGLMSWGTPDEGKAVVRDDDLTHLAMLSGGSEFLSALDVESVPTTFFIRADGTIAARQVGMRGERFFREQADKLLAGAL